MNQTKSFFVLFITGFILSLFSFHKLFATSLQNGPMLSDLTYREAQIWTQTESPATVSVHYFETNNPGEIFITPKIKTTESSGCTANLFLTKIEPNRKYSYYIEINGKLSPETYTFNSLNYYHEKEPPPEVRIAVLGAHYAIDPEFEPPYRQLGGGYSLFEKVYDNQPDIVLWAGNTAHLRKSDSDSKNGYFKPLLMLVHL